MCDCVKDILLTFPWIESFIKLQIALCVCLTIFRRKKTENEKKKKNFLFNYIHFK